MKGHPISWLNVQLPPETTEDSPELKAITKRVKIHPVLLKELMNPSARTRIEQYDGYLFVIYQFPIYSEVERVSKRVEIDLIITKKEVITVHYEPLEALTAFEERLANDTEFQAETSSNSLLFVYNLIEFFLNFNQRQLRHVREKVEEVGNKLFTDQERELLETIAYLKRDVSEYRIIFNPIGQLLASLQNIGSKFWGDEATPYLNDLHADYQQLNGQLEDYRVAILDFESTNSQLANHKATEVMKTFTILAFMTFPLMTFITLFSVRLHGIPFIEHPYGFWILIGIILIAGTGMAAYFKTRRWL